MKKRRFFSLMTTIALLLCLAPLNAFANTSNTAAVEKDIAQAEALLKSSLPTEEVIKQLEASGWVRGAVSPQLQPMSSGTCGSINPAGIFLGPSKGKYLVFADWTYSSSCAYDDNSDAAADAIALGLVDNSGNAVNSQATDAGITVKDEDGDVHNVGWVSSYSNSAVGYAFEDDDQIMDNIGVSGRAWFHIGRATGTEFYIRASYFHNWGESGDAFGNTEVTIGFPWAVAFTFSNSSGTVKSWTAAGQRKAYYPPEVG